jgi:hypothetical protein
MFFSVNTSVFSIVQQGTILHTVHSFIFDNIHAFLYNMERDIAIACAPVVYYGSCAYEAITEFFEVIIDRTCCGTGWR